MCYTKLLDINICLKHFRRADEILDIAVINAKKRLIERDEMKRKGKYKYKEKLKSRRGKNKWR